MSAAGDPLRGPDYGWYGDDFTGATDTLATIARRGWRAFLFLSVPTAAHLNEVGPLDAIGIAGAARSMTPEAMRTALPPIGRFFADRGVGLVHYKCCSTFDSAPHVGNLAVAIETLRAHVDHPIVPIIGGQPSLGRYCAFGTLFASAGDRVHRIDRHPTMSRHPATPMTEADLVRHFAALGLHGVAAVHWPAVAATLDGAWANVTASSPPAVLLDALDDGHLERIGQVLRSERSKGSMLVVGASSVAEAWFERPAEEPPLAPEGLGNGPVLAFVGSLSPITRGQMDAAKSYATIDVSPDAVMFDAPAREAAVAAALEALGEGRNVMVSTAPRSGPAPAVLARGLAEASAALVDEVLTRSKVTRVAIAGGDTSSMVTTALGFWGLGYHGLAARGVTVCRGRSENRSRDGMLVMLKGGQMGDQGVFDRFAG